MACYYPMQGYESIHRTEAGKRKIVFNPLHGYMDRPITVPCGQCIGCRLERSRQWAVRCVYESQLHSENSFITLTYSNNNLPLNNSLHKKDFQDFMKRLRKAVYPKKVRYYMCGEYGELTKRPHYHACLFGLDFEDKELWKISNGQRLYSSKKLAQIWGKGHVVIGDVTFESAAYISRYIMKKVLGEKAKDHYITVDESTGEISPLIPEYTGMSLKPGIAKKWFEKFKLDVFPADSVVINGKEMKTPKYYDRQYEITNPEEFVEVKIKRKRNALKREADNTYERLVVREKVKKAQVKQLVRNLHEEY